MKLIHIADTHLGLVAFNRLDPESGMNLREKQIYENFLKAIDEIIKQKPDVLVHAGDLFDTVKPKTRAYTTILAALGWLHEAGIPVVIIAGNHSMTKTRYTTSPFEVLGYHPSRMIAAYRFRYEKVEIGDTMFHLIPNMLRVEDYRTAYDAIELSGSHNNVLVTHGLATQLKDKRLSTVAEQELDNTILSEKFDYIALGHYHSQCKITDNAWYSGSLEHLTYGEIWDMKGGLTVDPGRHEVRHIDLPKTPMADCGTIRCHDMHPGDITEEIIAHVEQKNLPKYAMARVTLDGLSREHGKWIDTSALAGIRGYLLDLKIRLKVEDEDRHVPLQQDIRRLDYVQEFGDFIGKKNLTEKQREFVLSYGTDILQTVIKEHQETVE